MDNTNWYELDKHDCTIVDYHVEVNGEDYWGAVSGGSLKMLARARHVHGVVKDAKLAGKYFGRRLELSLLWEDNSLGSPRPQVEAIEELRPKLYVFSSLHMSFFDRFFI